MTEADRVRSTPLLSTSENSVLYLSSFVKLRPAAGAATAAGGMAEVIALDYASRRRQSVARTGTINNLKLRQERRPAWREAEKRVAYWRARIDMNDAIYCVQNSKLEEGNLHSPLTEDRFDLVRRWRLAVVWQIFTPASRLADVHWKERILANQEGRYLPITEAELRQVIAQDVEFLRQHPIRRARGEEARGLRK
ncbi:hypothetical protein [Bradyrhizobium liaoningense]|uniref:hypothetical protein n=1 Tax=Bradyrhizobium liaoningense TaxID=43992 RepID=UPI001BA9A27A|nr:hypothetical protein [Bradyrhizobium liaoningense]MBR0907031.1 hypothetical protein [Bradyrhizobium liaoningense]